MRLYVAANNNVVSQPNLPPAMPLISIATPFNIELELQTASMSRRGLAWLIDCVILFLYELAFGRAVAGSLPDDDVLSSMIVLFGMVLPVLLYHFLMETFFNGQSIGKKLLGIRVVSMQGNAASLSQYLIRLLFRSWFLVPVVTGVFAGILSDTGIERPDVLLTLAMLFLIGAIVGLFLYYAVNKHGQRLGDTLANTLVVEDRARTDLHQTIYLEIADAGYEPKFPQVMRLTDRDINGIRNLLSNRRRNREHNAYMERITARIKDALQIETELPAQFFLEQLLYDYNFLSGKSN